MPLHNRYIILEGAAVVQTHAGQELARLRRGQFVGEMCLLTDKPRSATVTAASLSGYAKGTTGVVSTKCLRLDRRDFERFVSGDLDRPAARAELLLAQVPLLSSLPASRRQALAKAMLSKTFYNTDEIIAQGAAGDTMYVIESGLAEITVAGLGVVAVKGRGEYFGEQALLHDAKRTASVIAKGTCCCLELDRGSFESLVLDAIGPLAARALWLAQVPLLESLEPGKRVQLANRMRSQEYQAGREVVRQGDIGDSMFIIESGAPLHPPSRFPRTCMHRHLNGLPCRRVQSHGGRRTRAQQPRRYPAAWRVFRRTVFAQQRGAERHGGGGWRSGDDRAGADSFWV